MSNTIQLEQELVSKFKDVQALKSEAVQLQVKLVCVYLMYTLHAWIRLRFITLLFAVIAYFPLIYGA